MAALSDFFTLPAEPPIADLKHSEGLPILGMSEKLTGFRGPCFTGDECVQTHLYQRFFRQSRSERDRAQEKFRVNRAVSASRKFAQHHVFA